MIKRTFKNKFLVTLAVILLILSTFLSIKVLAEVAENYPYTVESAEHDPNHEVGSGRYIPFANLRDYYDYFCCYHGGLNAHIPSYGNTLLKSELGTVSEPYLTYKDIGKKNFETTLEGENTETPFKGNVSDDGSSGSSDDDGDAHNGAEGGTKAVYTNETYSMYVAREASICGPKEAYILAEMMKNLPYPSDVQKAWWTTEAGSKGAIKLASNELAQEAEAFEAYILEAAEATSIKDLSTTTEINYTFEGVDRTLDCGFDFEYKPEYNEDANQDGKVETKKEGFIDGADDPTVCWDDDEQYYKIGPFSIDYIEAYSTGIEGREDVMFAGIVEAELFTDASDEPLKRGEDWDFLWINGQRPSDDEAEYPHKNEVFYIKMNYIEDATKVTDLAFYFEYMNAAGKYEYLDGKYFTATWTPKEKDNWCTEYHHAPHGSGDYRCSGTSCSYGKYRSHIISTTYWLELTNLTEHTSQLLALGLNAARIKNPAELHWDGGPLEEEDEAKLRIEKELVDATGNKVSSDKRFKFKIFIDGKYKETVSVKANGAVTRTYRFEKGKNPSYEVQEIPDKDTKLIDIENASGTLGNNKVIVRAINQSKSHHGSLRLDKIAIGNCKDKEYQFVVMIGNDRYDVRVSQSKGWSWTSPEYTWEGDNAPTYSVQEVNIPEGVKLISLSPSRGKLVDNQTTSQTTVVAINSDDTTRENEHGKIRITKKLDGNAISSDTYKFKITINGGIAGHQEIIASVKAGQTYQSGEITWLKGEPAPTYTVEEIDIPEGSKLIKIENSTGTLGNNQTAEVVAINELDSKSGKIKVTKEIITDDKVQNDAVDGTFTISVRISGTFEMNGESIVNGSRTVTNSLKAGESFETPEVKWYGNDAPTYTVTETEMPKGWKLDSISSSSGTLEENQTIDVTVTNKFSTRVIIDLTMEMAGDVWDDEPLNEEDKNTEDSVANGIYDRGQEEPIDGVLVNIYRVVYSGGQEVSRELATGYLDEEKTPITFPLVTGQDTESGHWFAPRMSVPALKENEKGQGLKARYDIEFIYDGQTYEPTKLLATSNGDANAYIKATTSERDKWQNDSMALDANREEVDNRVAEIKGDTPIDGSTGRTNGKVVGTDGTEYSIEYASLDNPNPNINRKISEVITREEGSNIAKDPFKASARTEKAGLLYPFDNKIHLESIDKYIDELGAVQKYKYSATYGYTQHINLGLKQRKTADLSAVKDLVSAKVAVNGKVLEYKYNKLLDKLSTTAQSASVSEVIANRESLYFQAKAEIPGYDLKLYGTDYYYRTDIYKDNEELYNDLDSFYKELGLEAINDRELDVFLKYRLNLYNDSLGGYLAEINEVLDYYDDSFELVETEVKKYVQTKTEQGLEEQLVTVAEPSTYNEGNAVSWTQTGEKVTDTTGKTYKVMKTNSLDGIKIKPGEKISIDVTFKLTKATDSQGVQDAIRMEGIDSQKSNIVEISNYSTFYGDSGKIAGKIDKDSAPDNVNLSLEKDGSIEGWFEDDTSAAPVLNMGLYETTRNIDGIAWEDKEEELVSEDYNEYVGNGIYDEGEKLLGGMTTDLVEKITVKNYSGGDSNIYKEYDFIWPTDKALEKLGGKSVQEITGFNSRTETAKAAGDGLEEGGYRFINVPAGNFVVRFTYGNKDLSQKPSNEIIKVFNGQDYKTTAYQVGFSNKDENGITNNEWHDLDSKELAEKRVSDARDSEVRRLEVIEKTKLITNPKAELLATANEEGDHEELYKEFYMYADTAKLNLEIEDLNSDALKEALNKNNNNTQVGGIKVNVIDGSITGGESYIINYNVEKIDVGIEERSRNEIVLDKQISRITLTTSDNKTIMDAKYDISYEPKVDERTGKTTWEAKVTLNSSSIGTDQLQALNKDEEKGIQNFRYINIDEEILQGTTIKMEYSMAVLNLGEVDLIGKDLEEFKTAEEMKAAREELIRMATLYAKGSDGKFERENSVGKYLGSTYYNGKYNEGNKDVVASVRVRQVIDYVDNDAVFAPMNNSGLNSSWKTVKEVELLGEAGENGKYADRLISMKEGIFPTREDGTIDTSVGSIVDRKGIKYNTDKKANIILSVESEEGEELNNADFIKKLVPYAADENKYSSQIALTTTKFFATESDANDMSFDNVAEIVKFESTVGRRDIETVVGNADPKDGEFTTSLEERDTSATELITLTPPTGASTRSIIGIQITLVVLVGLLIVAIGIIVIKKKVLTK
jgi:hypothetical protein